MLKQHKRSLEMADKRQVYLLDPQKLDPETIAVTFAKTSRSPQTFQEIARELTAEKSADFHEKWVVGYGHASVAEHAVLHIAIENISRLAVECLESNRLASYTEKSSRYQKWEVDRFAIPPEIENHPLLDRYMETCRYLNHAYQESLSALCEEAKKENPQQAGENDSAWERRLRAIYVDIARFYLPAASMANVGVTINARALEHALRKMLSHPLQEVREAGCEIKQVAMAMVPTLIKYVEAVPYLQQVEDNLFREDLINPSSAPGPDGWCQLVGYDHDSEDEILAASIYRYSHYDYAQILAQVKTMPLSNRKRIAEILLSNLGLYDIPLRELEYSKVMFDLTLDQGAYFELKRHRMMTQTPQRLTTHLGYCIPSMIVRAGLENHYRKAMTTARETYEILEKVNPNIAAYVVPNAYNRRVLLSMNLRTARHLIQLRTGLRAHFSIRRAAAAMGENVIQSSPLIGKLLFQSPLPDWRQIETEYFTQTA